MNNVTTKSMVITIEIYTVLPKQCGGCRFLIPDYEPNKDCVLFKKKLKVKEDCNIYRCKQCLDTFKEGE